MQRRLIVRRTVTKNCTILVYLTFFLAFASIAVWDVKEIITDYLEDNRFTLVRARNSVQEGYPFLDHFQLCLYYDQPLVAGLVWRDFNRLLNDSWHRRPLVWPPIEKSISEMDKSIMIKIFETMMYSFISVIDRDYRILNEFPSILGIDKSMLITLIDRLIDDRSIFGLLKEARSQSKSRFIQNSVYFKNKKSIDDISLDYIIFNDLFGEYYIDTQLKVCLTPLLARDMSTIRPGATTYSYALDLIYSESNSKVNQSYSKDYGNYSTTYSNPIPDSTYSKNNIQEPGSARIELRFLDDVIDVPKGPNNTSQTTDVTIEIINSQLFDTRRFPPCSIDFRSEQNCLDDRRRSIIEKICRCKQFSRAFEHFISNESIGQKDTRPFCTMQKYSHCREKADRIFSVLVANGEFECKPCLIAKNNYKLSTELRSYHMRYRPWHPRYTLIFVLKSQLHLVYEEKSQYNFSQLVSQIGGDLGLYIGFSMIGMLQLFFFLQHTYGRVRLIDPESNDSKKWKHWFGYFWRYIGESLKNSGCENASEIQELRERIEKQEKQLLGTMEQLRIAECKIEQLLKRQKSISLSISSENFIEEHCKL